MLFVDKRNESCLGGIDGKKEELNEKAKPEPTSNERLSSLWPKAREKERKTKSGVSVDLRGA